MASWFAHEWFGWKERLDKRGASECDKYYEEPGLWRAPPMVSLPWKLFAEAHVGNCLWLSHEDALI